MATPRYVTRHCARIQKSDIRECIEVLHEVMPEFGFKRTKITDADIESFWAKYNEGGAACFAYKFDGGVIGIIGVIPLHELEENACEIVQFSLVHRARGYGFGGQLFDAAYNFIMSEGYSSIYLETQEKMVAANGIYMKEGFVKLKKAYRKKPSEGCSVYLRKDLED